MTRQTRNEDSKSLCSLSTILSGQRREPRGDRKSRTTCSRSVRQGRHEFQPPCAVDTLCDDLLLLAEFSGGIMTEQMATFRVSAEIENPAKPGERRMVESALVDTGAELSWFPAELLETLGVERYTKLRFRQADGTILERWTGSAWVHVADKRTADDVVFGQPGDLVLLGGRTLEGLNFRVEPTTQQLVDAGPVPAAAANSKRTGWQLATGTGFLLDAGYRNVLQLDHLRPCLRRP